MRTVSRCCRLDAGLGRHRRIRQARRTLTDIANVLMLNPMAASSRLMITEAELTPAGDHAILRHGRQPATKGVTTKP
jgi:hypothetical protein